MRRDDAIRVRHMLDAAREAISFIRDKNRSNLETDRMLVLSLIKSIEIIGEAASSVTQELRNLHPQIPWRDIVATRNRLIHVYFDIDLDRVWDTLSEDLPNLIQDLELLLQNEQESP